MGEVIYLYRRKGLDYWCTCDADRYMRFQERPLFEVKIARNDIDYADLEHEIDAMRAENAELVAALIEAQKIINHQGWSTPEQPAYDAIDAALAKHRVRPACRADQGERNGRG